MGKHLYTGIILLLVAAGACVGSKKKQGVGIKPVANVEFVCIPVVNDKPFYLDSVYVNAADESYTINNLKFFLTDIAFSRSNTPERAAHSDAAAQGVFFVDLTETKQDTATGFLQHTTSFTTQTGDYSDIRFSIGVPRALNHSDPTMAPYPLDVGNADMFWEWNSGYIFFLAEGRSPVAEDSLLHLAIGGDARIMPISFGDIFNAVPLIQVKENTLTRIYVKLDINKLFVNPDNQPYSFRLAEASVVHNGRDADLLRLNILQALEFVSVESIPLK